MAKTDLTLRIPKGSPLTHSEQDKNFQRLLYAQSLWQSGQQYTANELVYWEGGLWYCIAQVPTSAEPTSASADWVLYSPNNGLGSILQTSPAAGADIGAAWQAITYYDTETIAGVGVSFDLVGGTFSFSWPGVWRMDFGAVIEFAEAQQARELLFRLFNTTDAAGGSASPVFVARNQTGTNVSVGIQFVIPPADLVDVWRFEVSGGVDTFSAVNWDTVSLDLQQITPRFQ